MTVDTRGIPWYMRAYTVAAALSRKSIIALKRRTAKKERPLDGFQQITVRYLVSPRSGVSPEERKIIIKNCSRIVCVRPCERRRGETCAMRVYLC